MTAGRNLRLLPSIVAVRRRPEMWLSREGAADIPRALVAWVVTDLMREQPVGPVLDVQLEVGKDRSLTCIDDGPGLPVERRGTAAPPSATDMISACVVGGRERGWNLSTVGAFCSRVELELCTDGRRYSQEFTCEGPDAGLVPVADLADHGACDDHGTRVTWWLAKWLADLVWPQDVVDWAARVADVGWPWPQGDGSHYIVESADRDRVRLTVIDHR